VSQKMSHCLIVHIFTKYRQILKIFYWHTLWIATNSVAIKHLTTPELHRYTTMQNFNCQENH